MRADDDRGAAIRDGSLVAYRPMPPIVVEQLEDGRVERTIAVGYGPPAPTARITRSSASGPRPANCVCNVHHHHVYWRLDFDVDDGVNFTTDPDEARAHLDAFVDGQSIFDTDVVLWYSAHFTHDTHGEQDAGEDHGHIVGPDLVPGGW